MKYRVIERLHLADLVKDVQEALREGWLPQGGITYGNGYYLQAVVLP